MKRLFQTLILVNVATIILGMSSLSQSVFEVRYIEKAKHPGAVLFHLEGSRSSYYVGGHVIGLSEVDSARARSNIASNGQPAYSVTIYLKKQLKERWRRFTERNIQQRIAILVDGKLRAAPLIVNAFSSPVVMLPVSSEGEAGDIERRIAEAARAQTH